MIDNIRESKTMAKTFRFASDQVLTVDEDKIEKIPYLAAIVSSADHFESVRNKLGHYKLDPHIEYKHFCFALESLSFHSVRQIFNHLPKQNDVMRIIALLDFLGIGPQPDPTLREVDSIFFSNLVYSPTLGKYVQIVRPSVIQNMAVRFAIAMAKEEYDFTSEAVIDQIYCFYPWYSEDLPKEICDIWKHELIQKKIRELILEEISVLTPKLEQKRNELVTKIREYEQSHDISHEPMLDIFNFHLFYFNPFHRSSFEILQEEALSYELILDILRQGSSIEEEIHWRVLKALHVAALEQFVEWKNTQQDITKLHDELSSYLPRETFLSVVLSNTIYPNHQVPVNKPKSLPKLQLKYSMRQLNVFRS
ncbi:unnamed protein product [Rotaria sp. Silwood2]|nr:unnamed protein product [Rotaria sp. Silwood2]